MDLLREIFEDTTHEISRWQYNEDSQQENEDQAIAVILAEKEKIKKAIKDEHSARVLNESLKRKSSHWKRILKGIIDVFDITIKCDVYKRRTINYRTNHFWAQRYCSLHKHDGTPCCYSCNRIESRETRYVALEDGRKECLKCLDSAVLDATGFKPIFHNIQRFFEGLDMKVEQNFPLLLVNKQELDRVYREIYGHNHKLGIRGLCHSQEKVNRRVAKQLRFVESWFPNLKLEPDTVRSCKVKKIQILYGLPRFLTGSILAHEMMHAWFRQNGCRNLHKYVEEGMCQVLAHMWLTSQINSTSSTHWKRYPFEKKIADFFKYEIESRTDEVYGDGFRAANQVVLKHGLQKTLHHIRLTGKFPN
ncbi:protein DA1-related 1-like [Rutidosis leptorrhynchoides]|uniref:protein DA1-related 1-like n=1 Tax=Rutidosis leptorrhynchoides TaxID=125765 RepID=UPI003A9990E5